MVFAPGVWIALALAVLMAFVLSLTVFGRRVFALGSSEPAARACGIAIDRLKLAIYGVAVVFTISFLVVVDNPLPPDVRTVVNRALVRSATEAIEVEAILPVAPGESRPALTVVKSARLETAGSAGTGTIGYWKNKEPAEVHEFWMSMARHEAGHVGALELLEIMIEQAGTVTPVSPLTESAQAATAVIERVHAEADGPLSLTRAFELAIELESAEVEDLVCDLFAILADEEQRYQAEQMLVHDLSDFSLMIEKYAHDDALLARADALVERHVGRRERRGRG